MNPIRTRLAGETEAILMERPGAQELRVRIEATGEMRRALNLISLTGRAQVGCRVLLNTSAVEMGLGTGGLDFVVTIFEEARLAATETPPGHLMKLRYTPHQLPVLCMEAPESPHHAALRHFTSLEGLPVVCTELHSQLPAVLAGAHWAFSQSELGREPRLVYVMTDSASLSLALSRLVPELKASGLLKAAITCGQAFGGDYEAVNLYSALAAAKEVLNADLVVTGQGPGNAGTETPLGFSGVDQGEAVNAAASLSGIPVAVLRLSLSDPRPRHQGISHHTRTVLQTVARAPAFLPVPVLPSPEGERILREAETLQFAGATEVQRHQPVLIGAEGGLELLKKTGISVSTMGRSLQEERAFFGAAAAAGILGAQLAEARGFVKT